MLVTQVWVNVGDIVLLGLRDFQDTKADVILKYMPDEARQLQKQGVCEYRSLQLALFLPHQRVGECGFSSKWSYNCRVGEIVLKTSRLSFDVSTGVDALLQVRFQYQPKSMRKSRTLGRAGSLMTTVEMTLNLTQVRVQFFTHRRQSSNVSTPHAVKGFVWVV